MMIVTFYSENFRLFLLIFTNILLKFLKKLFYFFFLVMALIDLKIFRALFCGFFFFETHHVNFHLKSFFRIKIQQNCDHLHKI